MTRVLVVDDDRDVAESLGMVMEGLSCEVELAFNGAQAVAQYQEGQHDLVLMDVRMPIKNGVEAFLEIRQTHPQAHVMMMTGYSVEHLLETAMNQGAMGVLRKPIDLNQLRAMLSSVQSAKD
jgi:two-component system, NtrC family, response regulator HydG